MKKNSSFIKKIKLGITKENYASVLKDIKTLSLEKYLTEIINAINDSLEKNPKTDDILATLEILSALHQRFSTKFTPYILCFLLQGFENPPVKPQELFEDNIEIQKPELARINKQKTYLRIFFEGYLAGLFINLDHIEQYPNYVKPKNTSDLLLVVLKEILNYQVKFGKNISITVRFLKWYKEVADQLPSEVSQLLKSYSEVTYRYTNAINEKITKLENKNTKISIRTGKFNPDLLREIELNQELLARFLTLTETLALVLEIEPLLLREVAKEDDEEEDSIVSVANSGKTDNTVNGVVIWQNDDEHKFYQDYALLEDKDFGGPGESEPLDVLSKMNEFISKMESCASVRDVDELGLLYWSLKLDNRASRNRLLKVFLETNDTAKLKYYGRFLAINRELLAELIEELIDQLDKSFRYQIYSSSATRINFRNISFFVELIKFNLMPTHITFHKLRSLILNLSSTNNIDTLSIYFDQCGRYLYYANGPESRALMEEMLELLKAKRTQSSCLSLNDKMAIDNLLLIIKPPSVRSLPAPVVPTQEQFITLLMNNEIKHLDKLRMLIKKLDWETNFEYISRIFTSPQLINYDNIGLLAKLLSLLVRHSRTLVVYAIDELLEQIQRGLEVSSFKYNRIRVAQIKYLGELMNANIVKQQLVFKILYKLITFGHQGIPRSDLENELDLPTDYFRVNLIIVLLETVNGRVTAHAQLNSFLLFLNYYVLTKQHPLPMELRFKVAQTFQAFGSYEYRLDISVVFQELSEQYRRTADAFVEEEEEDFGELEDESDEVEDEVEELEETDSEDEEELDEEADQDSAEEELEEEYEELEDDEDDEDDDVGELKRFEEDMNKLILDSLEARKSEKITKFTAHLPKELPQLAKELSQQAADALSRVAFSLVTRSNKGKQVVKKIEISRDEKFAVDKLQQQEKTRSENEKIKRIVLNMRE